MDRTVIPNGSRSHTVALYASPMENPIATAEASTAEPVTEVGIVEAGIVEPGTNVIIEAELLIEEISIDGMCGVY